MAEKFQEHEMLFSKDAEREKVQNIADEEFQEHELLFSKDAEREEVGDLADDEEFQEHEMLFPENAGQFKEIEDVADEEEDNFQICPNINIINNNKLIKQNSISLPVNIPNNNASRFKYMEKKSNFFEDEYTDDYGERVPPHLIISRRFTERVMAFSVCTGYERFKGRDMFEFRDTVLRMTGFLEA